MTEKEFQAFGLRLTKAVKDAGVRGPAHLAKLTGLNRVTLGAYMRGDRAASLEACVAIAQALNVSPTWLHGGREHRADQRIMDLPNKYLSNPQPKNFSRDNDSTSDTNRIVRIPLYSAALAGPDGSVSIGASFMEMIESPTILASVPDAYAVRVVGESMTPRYEPGEVVYVHPRMPVKKGDYILAQVAEDGSEGNIMGYVKRLVSIDDRKLVVEQLHPKREMTFPRNRVRSVHKIVLAG